MTARRWCLLLLILILTGACATLHSQVPPLRDVAVRYRSPYTGPGSSSDA